MSIIDARVIQKTDTEDKWLQNELTLYKGELALVQSGNQIINIKVGTGKHKFRELPYLIDYTSGLYTKAITPSSYPSGDAYQSYIVTEAGTYTNFGGVVLPKDNIGVIYKNLNQYTISLLPIVSEDALKEFINERLVDANLGFGGQLTDLSQSATVQGMYIPRVEGVYPNFGGLEYDSSEGLVIFLYKDNEYTKISIPLDAVDEDVRFNNEVLGVSGKAVEKFAVKKINNIAELRNTQGEYEGQIIELLGYYKAGDKKSLNYKWTSEQNIDDGGAVINTDAGSWNALLSNNINPLDFGAKGGSDNDDTEFLQKTLNFLEFNPRNVVFDRIYYITSQLNIPYNSIGSTFSSINNRSYTKCGIWAKTGIEIPVLIRNYSQGITISNLSIQGSGLNKTDVLLLCKRVDSYPNTSDVWGNDLVNNIDLVVTNCDIGNANTHLEVWGRQLTIESNVFSAGKCAIKTKQFNTLGKYGGSSRGFRIWNNFFHSFDSGNANREVHALIINDTIDGYGFNIVNNFSDSFNTFFKGNLVNSILSNTHIYTLVGYFVFANEIRNSNINNNNFINAQKYEDTGTNPPYICSGGVYSEKIIDSNINDNLFSPCKNSIIKSNGVINTNINSNKFNRWGVEGGNKTAIVLDSFGSNSDSKSSNVNITDNTFYNSIIVDCSILETSTFSNTINYGINSVVLENSSTITNFFKTNNSHVNSSFIKRRNLINNENIDNLQSDINQVSGIYTKNNLSMGIAGLPEDSIGNIEVYVTNIGITRYYQQKRGSGGKRFVQMYSDGIWSSWVEIIYFAKSVAVSNTTTSDATDLATALTLVNELKAKLNAKLTADRNSGQQAT